MTTTDLPPPSEPGPCVACGKPATTFTPTGHRAHWKCMESVKTTQLADALDETAALLRRFVHFHDHHQAVVVALFAAATYRTADFAIAPYLHIRSPEPDAGKSTLAKLVSRVAANGLLVGGGVSASWIFRKLDSDAGATLIVDEMDNLWKVSDQSETKAALAQILNCGFDRELALVGRVERTGGKFAPVEYGCFGFKVIVGIGDLPPVVATRAIPIILQRARPGELADHYRPTKAQRAKITAVADALEMAMAKMPELSEIEPANLPEGMTNRVADLWLPLVVVADQAGGEWPTRVREAARAMLTNRADTAHRAAVVRDLAEVVPTLAALETASGSMLPSETLVGALRQVEGGPWAGEEGGRRQLTAKRLATLLHPYALRSELRRVTGRDAGARGYLVAELVDLIARYSPTPPAQSVAPVTTQSPPGFFGDPVVLQDAPRSTSQSVENPMATGDVTGVTHQRGGEGEREDDGGDFERLCRLLDESGIEDDDVVDGEVGSAGSVAP